MREHVARDALRGCRVHIARGIAECGEIAMLNLQTKGNRGGRAYRAEDRFHAAVEFFVKEGRENVVGRGINLVMPVIGVGAFDRDTLQPKDWFSAAGATCRCS